MHFSIHQMYIAENKATVWGVASIGETKSMCAITHKRHSYHKYGQ